MKKLNSKRLIAPCLAMLIGALAAPAQEQRNDWAMPGADAAQSGWQKDELGLSPDSIAGTFKYLWKFPLGHSVKATESFNEPLLIGRVINAEGFKDIVFMTSADTLYAVDSELGSLIWKKQFEVAKSASSPGCEVTSLPMLLEPPVTINFNARRRRAPGTPRPPDPPPAQSNERRLGVAPGGGYFGFKGIYVLTPDGMLHEQIVTTGADFAAPVKFLPAPGAKAASLSFADKTIYTATTQNCGGVPNGEWSISLSSGDYLVKSAATGSANPLSLTGPVLTPEEASLLVTGPGTASGAADSAEAHPGSVVALSKDMKVQDWFTPREAMASYGNVSPSTFDHAGKQFIVAPGEPGTIALLDAASLGGTGHDTPLFQTPAVSSPGEKHPWDGFAIFTAKDGTAWIFASISAGITLNDSAVQRHGSASHGGIVAFKVEEQSGKPSLQPVWISEDMVNPAPPRVTNGVVIAPAGGDKSTNAVLHVLNAATGAELYSSAKEIPTYSHLSGVTIGDSHAFFTDHDGVLYSFGIGLEH